MEPEELKLTLEKMYNWLQPGGKIYLITDTCYSGPWKKHLPEFERRLKEGDPFPGFIEDVLKCLPVSKLPKGMTSHMHCLDPDTLSRECKLAGFEILEAEFLGKEKSGVVLIGTAILVTSLIIGMIVLGSLMGIEGIAYSFVIAHTAKTSFYLIKKLRIVTD